MDLYVMTQLSIHVISMEWWWHLQESAFSTTKRCMPWPWYAVEIKDKKYKVPNLDFWKKGIRPGTFWSKKDSFKNKKRTLKNSEFWRAIDGARTRGLDLGKVARYQLRHYRICLIASSISLSDKTYISIDFIFCQMFFGIFLKLYTTYKVYSRHLK